MVSFANGCLSKNVAIFSIYKTKALLRGLVWISHFVQLWISDFGQRHLHKKMVDPTGFGPATSSLRTRRSPNWAMDPSPKYNICYWLKNQLLNIEISISLSSLVPPAWWPLNAPKKLNSLEANKPYSSREIAI